jgi:hypothetical protein
MDSKSVTGEWLVEGRLMAGLVVRRITDAYPHADAGYELVTIYESESAWAREAWPLDRIMKQEKRNGLVTGSTPRSEAAPPLQR